MSWLVKEKGEQPITTFRKMLNSKEGIVTIPGAHDAMASLLAKEAGFRVLYLSGGALTASLGLPDLGILTLTELANRVREITRATGLPLLVDVDTGYGGILNVTRTVYEMAEAGAAGIQIEDQEMPKKCGHLNGKKLISQNEMVQKIKAARQAHSDLVITARTDANSVEGIDAAVERAKAYMDAGADIIFPEALQTEEEFIYFGQQCDFPLLANMTEFGRTPYINKERFAQFGYQFVIFPVTSLRVAAKAMENMYQHLYMQGTQKELIDSMQTRMELYKTIRYDDYEALDQNISKTVLNNLYS